MRSASGPLENTSRSAAARIFGTATALVVTAGLLAGCTTTQHEAQRMQVDSARERAAVLTTKVISANPLVSASVSATVAKGGKTAVIVSVHNSGRKAVTDLPISVGYSLPGKPRVYLNSESGLYYFEAHLPAIFAGKSRIWVYTADRALPKGARPFALVGSKPSVPALLTDRDVSLVLDWGSNGGSQLHIALQNPSSVPQYQLQLYAYAKRAGRYVAAGNTTVTDLGAGSHQSLTLELVGAPQGATVQVEADPYDPAVSTMTETEQQVLPREQCEQCAAPVAADQRYCVNCGTRRTGTFDPAASYFSEASAARARVAAATRARAAAGRKRPTHLRIPATLLALIVVAAGAVGFGIGSSSGGTTGTTTTTIKSPTTSTAQAKTSTGTTTSGATGKNYSSQEKKDNSVVAEP